MDDNTAIPFNLENIVKEMDETNLYSGIPIPAELSSGGSSPQTFSYLRRDLKSMMAGSRSQSSS